MSKSRDDQQPGHPTTPAATAQRRRARRAVLHAGGATIAVAVALGASAALGPRAIDAATFVQGATGPTGSTGAPGPVGATGVTGTRGVSGAAGVRGATGATGGIGPQGPVGAIGAAGATGAVGATGVDGVSGAVGAMGVTGATGTIGVTGPTGLAGPDGPSGAVLATLASHARLSVTLSLATGGMPYIHEEIIACPTGMIAVGGGYNPSTIADGVQLQTSWQANSGAAWQLNLLVTSIPTAIPPTTFLGYISCVAAQ